MRKKVIYQLLPEFSGFSLVSPIFLRRLAIKLAIGCAAGLGPELLADTCLNYFPALI